MKAKAKISNEKKKGTGGFCGNTSFEYTIETINGALAVSKEGELLFDAVVRYIQNNGGYGKNQNVLINFYEEDEDYLLAMSVDDVKKLVESVNGN